VLNERAIKGEPNTGYEGPEKGPFTCGNCEYFDNGACNQKDMMKYSQLPRDAKRQPQVDPNGCCEYVDRKGAQVQQQQSIASMV
jgi:hypothetical protein